MSPTSARQLEESMLRGEQFVPTNDLSSLLKISPQIEDLHQQSAEEEESHDDLDSTLGFLSPAHETEYTSIMDTAQLGSGILKARDRRSSLERGREAVFRNPLSVYNWLKKNQSNVFQQHNASHDGDSVSDKPTGGTAGARGGGSAGSRGSRRGGAAASASAAAAPAREEDMYDEDGIAIDVAPEGGRGRGKRKREEDTGYRPKGGSGGRGKKRGKRGSGGGSAA